MIGIGDVWTYVKGKLVTVMSTENIMNALKDKFDYYEEEIAKLRAELNKYKNNLFRDEELARLKQEYEEKNAQFDSYLCLDNEEKAKIAKWIKKRKKVNTGAIGGRYEYRFVQTSIGSSGTIVDTITGDSFNFRELN